MLCAAGFVLMLAGYARPVGGTATAAMLGGGGLFWTGALLLGYATLW
jgi:hypothetical protein